LMHARFTASSNPIYVGMTSGQPKSGGGLMAIRL
jgi:hypothetical protein